MARWMVNQSETQFAVSDFQELEQMVRSGRVVAGDMIQPPGTSEWLYATEITELTDALEAASVYDTPAPPASSGLGAKVFGLVLVGVLCGAGFTAYRYMDKLPTGEESLTDTVSYSELIVTGHGTPMLAEPVEGAKVKQALKGGAQLALLAKRGAFYRVRDQETSNDGWVSVTDTLPMYLLGGGKEMEKYDPLFNPDRYVDIANAGWMVMNEETRRDGDLMQTVFDIELTNRSQYDMTDLRLVTTIKDAKGHELQSVEFAVQGVVPAHGSTMVGTLLDPTTETKQLITIATFDEMKSADPNLALNFSTGIELEMEPADVAGATPKIAELRAIPAGKGTASEG